MVKYIPPLGITATWELVKVVRWENINTTTQSDFHITGLDGNTDEVWKLVILVRNPYTCYIGMRFNLATTEYRYSLHETGLNAGSALHAVYNTLDTGKIYLNNKYCTKLLFEILIYPKSGDFRPYVWSGNAYTAYDNFTSINGGGVWTNTTNNITSIDLYYTGSGTAPGFYMYCFLFRKREA
jgi:hypothetical protein